VNRDVKKGHRRSNHRTRPWRRAARGTHVAAIAGAILGALAGAGVIASCERASEVEPPGEMAGVPQVSTLFNGIPEQGPALGDPAAPVTLTEVADLQCPHCRDFARISLPVLIERYVRAGRLRVVLHNLPILGEDSERAARMAVAAGLQDRMWPFVDLFFWNQGAEGTGYVTDAFLHRIAAAVPGLDADRAMHDRGGPLVTAHLQVVAQHAHAARISSTPTFLVGRTGERPYELGAARAADPQTFVGPIEELLENGRDSR
jgi:hypothetical protein